MVDDDHNDLALMGLAIDRLDLMIWLQTAADGEQAIEYLEGKGTYADRDLHPLPDLILLDLRMQRVDGFDFLNWRKQSPTWSRIPVIIFSASANPPELQRAMAAGGDYQIPKPNQFGEWKVAVQQIWDYVQQHPKAGGTEPAA